MRFLTTYIRAVSVDKAFPALFGVLSAHSARSGSGQRGFDPRNTEAPSTLQTSRTAVVRR